MKSIILSLLDKRTAPLLKLGSLLVKEGFIVNYFSNEKINLHSDLNDFLFLNEDFIDKIDPTLELKFKKIYKTDRSLYFYFSEQKALKLMQSWYNKSILFIEKHQIEYCMIEGTPAHELVFELACLDQKVGIMNIFHSPGPRGWSLISKSSVEYPLYSNMKKNLDYVDSVNNQESSRKIYVDIKESKIFKALRFIKRKKNYNYYPKSIIIFQLVLYPIALFLTWILCRLSRQQHNHVMYLHMEPERTVYNCDADFSSQISALNFLTKELGFYITLKEHPSWIGKRDIRFYLQVLLNPRLNYYMDLEKIPKLVWTFSGSVAWERIKEKSPTVVLGRTYLHKSKYVRNFPNIYCHVKKVENNFFEVLSNYAFEGEMNGENLSPSVSDEGNIKKLYEAIKICIANENI